VPGAGSGLAGATPVGSGIVLAGSEYLRLSHNEIRHNGAWGILVADLPDQETPPPISHCEGGVYVIPPPLPLVTCYYQAFGNQVIDNRFTKHNGFFGNPTNGDIGFGTTPHDPGNCLHGNTDPDGLSMDPPGMQSLPIYSQCGQPNTGDFAALAAEALCATELVFPCPTLPGVSYPRTTGVDISMPPPQRTMRDPCAGVPANPWCPR
jgi:hypothetical protein